MSFFTVLELTMIPEAANLKRRPLSADEVTNMSVD